MIKKLVKILFGTEFAFIYFLLKFLKKLYNYLKIMYMNEGLIPEEKAKEFADVIDGLIPFDKIAKRHKGFFKLVLKSAELVDGKLILAGFEYVDNKYAEHLPARFKKIYIDFVNNVADKQFDKIQESAAELINVFVNIPELNEGEELELISANLMAIVKIIKRKLAK
jgi:hypothetical protein